MGYAAEQRLFGGQLYQGRKSAAAFRRLYHKNPEFVN